MAAAIGAPSPAGTIARESGAHYAQLFGQSYRTRVPLYLFTLYDDPDAIYLGRTDPSRHRLTDLPEKIDVAFIGKSSGHATLLDVVPAGAEIVLIAETHEVTAESGIRDLGGYPLGLIGMLTYGERIVPGVRCEFIQRGEKAPARTPNQRIDEQIATRAP